MTLPAEDIATGLRDIREWDEHLRQAPRERHCALKPAGATIIGEWRQGLLPPTQSLLPCRSKYAAGLRKGDRRQPDRAFSVGWRRRQPGDCSQCRARVPSLIGHHARHNTPMDEQSTAGLLDRRRQLRPPIPRARGPVFRRFTSSTPAVRRPPPPI
ncbi:hypothetical protein MRX96_019193 [Rhipicephalus microplus]